MTSQTPDPRDETVAPSVQREDACGAAPQAVIGTPAGNPDIGTNAPHPPHADSIRQEIAGSEDAEEIVYDDRTDDRPTP